MFDFVRSKPPAGITAIRCQLVVAVCCMYSLMACPLASRADWTVSRGDGASSGVASGSIPERLQVQWEYSPEKSGFEGTPIIAEGRVFVGDVEGTIHALDMNTGDLIWKKSTKHGFITAGAYRDGRLVLGDFDGKVYCLKTADGEIEWEQELAQQIAAGGNFFGEDILLSTEGGVMYALNMKTGKPRWEYSTGDQLRSAPTIWKNFALLGGCDGRLHKIDLNTGTAVGDGLPLEGPTGSTPAVLGDTAIVPTQSGIVSAFDLVGGKQLWEFKDAERSQEIRSSPAVMILNPEGPKTTGIAIVTTRNRRVLAIDTSTGTFVWETVLRKRSDASVLICDNRVWAVGTDGMVQALDLKTGEERWSKQLTGQIIASPAISHEKLYVATEKGSIVCFGAAK
jgi:outer membrane protein assembly factor BamB